MLYVHSIEKFAMIPPHGAQELAVLFAKFAGLVTMTGIGEILMVLQSHDISTPRFAVLKHLNSHNGATVSTIAHTLGLTIGSTSQLIDRLEVDGLVYRLEDDADRRVRRVYLNDRGDYLINQLKTMRIRQLEEQLVKLPNEVIMQLTAALNAAFPFITKDID